jgi:acetylornithine deacetylase
MSEFDAVRAEVQTLLLDLIRFPSTRGHEGPAVRYLCEQMRPLVDECRLVAIDDALMQDPDYAFPLPGHSYQDTPNLEARLHGRGGRSLIFNTHLDVVPPSEGQADAFEPHEAGGIIFGRGACDAKGQAAMFYTLARLLRERGLRPAGDLTFHFVVEEECGGNGSLAMVRRGVRADAVVVGEPTNLAVVPAVRGAVWFELRVFGRAGHSGNVAGRVSAVDKAIQAIRILQDYHDQLLDASRHLPLFDQFPDPMPLTVGQFEAGHWPSSVPSEAVLKGVLGFLPNKNRREVMAEMDAALRIQGDEWLREHFRLSFPMLHSDGNQLPVDHPLVTSLLAAVRGRGLPDRVTALTGSADPWFYQNMARIPTVVFGPGSIVHAHAKDEQVKLDDILAGAAVLADFVEKF